MSIENADLAHFFCFSSNCPDHHKRGAGNLHVTGHYGPKKTRLLRCRTCKTRFSERKGTPLFHCRLDLKTHASILEHVQDGCGVRQTGRLCKVNRKTVARHGLRAGEHAKHLHDHLVAFSPSDEGTSFRREVVLR